MTGQITENTQDTTQSTINVKDSLNSGQKGTQLVETLMVEDTPFTILKWDEKYYLCLGKYRLTEALDSKEQAMEEVNNASWFRMLQIIHAVVHEEIKADKLGKGLQAINNQ